MVWYLIPPWSHTSEHVFGVNLLSNLPEKSHALRTVASNHILSLVLVRIISKDVRVIASQTPSFSDDIVHESTRSTVHKNIVNLIRPGNRQFGDHERLCPVSQAQDVRGGVTLVYDGRERLKHKREDNAGHILDRWVMRTPFVTCRSNNFLGGQQGYCICEGPDGCQITSTIERVIISKPKKSKSMGATKDLPDTSRIQGGSCFRCDLNTCNGC